MNSKVGFASWCRLMQNAQKLFSIADFAERSGKLVPLLCCDIAEKLSAAELPE